jgi:hypothetical protein
VSRLDNGPWSRLETAYGPAGKVPAWLKTLLTAKDDRKCRTACEHLFNVLWHQGTIFEATAPAVAFLVRALRACPAGCRVTVVDLLDHIADGMSYHAQHEDLFLGMGSRLPESAEYQQVKRKQLEWVKACEAAVWEGFETYLPLLRARQADVRLAVPCLLATLLRKDRARRPAGLRRRNLDRQVSDAIVRQCLPAEKDPFVRCSCVFALSSIAARHPPNLDALQDLLEDPEERVRICAAVGLVDHGRHGGPLDVVIDALSRCAQTDRLFNNELPWFQGWLRFLLVGRLCALPHALLDRVLPALLAAIDAASHHTVDAEIAPILHFVFQGRQVDVARGAQGLTEAERAVLTRIHRNKKMWDPRSGNAELVFRRIGLKNSRAQWGRLLGKR